MRHRFRSPSERVRAAVSLLETLFAVAIVNVVGSAGVVMVGEIRDGASSQNLSRDVATIDSALRVGEAHGSIAWPLVPEFEFTVDPLARLHALAGADPWPQELFILSQT